MLSPLAALILGALQGLLEWLPISSEGNLTLIMVALLRVEPSEALKLSLHLHLGSGLAALIYFRNEILGILLRRSKAGRALFRFLFLSTALTGVVGLPLYFLTKNIAIDVIMMGLTGGALVTTGVIERLARRIGARVSESLSDADAIMLGLVQGVSVVPGVSRSGVTTSALLLREFSGEEALRVSFLMSVPAIFAALAGLIVLEGLPTFDSSFLLGIVSSFISSLLFLDIMLRVARRVRFWAFCIGLGALALLPLIFYLI